MSEHLTHTVVTVHRQSIGEGAKMVMESLEDLVINKDPETLTNVEKALLGTNFDKFVETNMIYMAVLEAIKDGGTAEFTTQEAMEFYSKIQDGIRDMMHTVYQHSKNGGSPDNLEALLRSKYGV